ncbi:MAG: transporter ATP-binding protein [Conexibacter sp.]|nr:transporter ATP-binding protein [Conexibacter sp.]
MALAGLGLTRTFHQGETTVRAVDGVSLTVDAGELVVVNGPSGSGKSTLLHLLGGLDRPDAGRVLLEGEDLSRLTERQLALVRRRRIGFLLQFFSLLPTLTVLENVALPLLLDGASHARARAEEALRRTGVAQRRAHRPGTLSGGEQQRAALARAIVTNPAVLLADEPTGSLDSASGQRIFELLREVAADTGVIVVSHDPRAAGYADRVVHLADGRVVVPEPHAPLASSRPR